MSGSVSFDRAARDYDRTRGMSAEARERVADLMQQELSGRGLTLEVGIGTGRISLPLHQRGIPIAGVDLSAAMLDKLVENAGGRRPFPLGRADATRLPFRDGSFGAAMACHIFHLIPNWPDAITEMLRVVRPGGVVLVDSGSMKHSPFKEMMKQLLDALGLARRFPGLDAFAGDPVDAAEQIFAAHGCGERSLPEVASSEPMTLAETLEQFASRTWSWTWDLPEEDVSRAEAEVRAWALEQFGDLDRPITIDYPVRWKAFDLP